MMSAIEKDILTHRLRMIAPDSVERAIDEAIRHAATTLHGTFSGYLDWCIERGMVGAPMPWIDPHWELRRAIEMFAGKDYRALRDFWVAVDRYGHDAKLLFDRVYPELARSRQLREQSWKRRKTGRAVK